MAPVLHLLRTVAARLLILVAVKLLRPQQRLRVILNLKSRASANLQSLLACVRCQDTMIRLVLSRHQSPALHS
jgi:hypothetical protein